MNNHCMIASSSYEQYVKYDIKMLLQIYKNTYMLFVVLLNMDSDLMNSVIYLECSVYQIVSGMFDQIITLYKYIFTWFSEVNCYMLATILCKKHILVFSKDVYHIVLETYKI